MLQSLGPLGSVKPGNKGLRVETNATGLERDPISWLKTML